jgi:hypothetical protein
MLEHDPDNAITLRLYCAPNGQWSGTLFVGVEEIGDIAACNTREEVEQAADETGLYPDNVEVEAS